MTRPNPRRRQGFTVLEVLLASVIGVLLLGGLYVAFDLTLSRADLVREEAARADLSRAVLNRLQLDIAATLGPLPPQSGGQSTGATATSTDAGTTSTTTDAAATATTTTGTGTTTTTEVAASTTTTTDGSTTTDTGEATTATPTLLPFGAGIIGGETEMTLFVARVPAGVADRNAFAAGDSALAGDMRKVTYYVGPDGGLCRQEQPWVTASGVGDSTAADTSTAAGDLIAPEVASATFEYYDGSAWQPTWDGSALGADGSAILGPPRAVRVTLTLAFPEPGGLERRKTVIQVFAVRAAAAPASVASGTTTDETTGETP